MRWKNPWLLSPLLALLLTGCPLQEPPPTPSVTCPDDSGSLTHALTPYKPGELLVQTSSPVALAQSFLNNLQLEPLTTFLETDWYRVKVPKGEERIWMARLKAAGARDVEYNYLLKKLAVPNDPDYPEMQRIHFHTLLGLEDAWGHTKGDATLKLAVVDQGYKDHPDINDRLDLSGLGLDVADSDNDPEDLAPEGHSIAVAGVLGAETNNNYGMAGVTWYGPIIPVKVFPDSDPDNADFATVAAGIDKAAELGAKVINLSLGGTYQDSSEIQSLESALRAARDQGIIIVAAAGNDGKRGVFYPASSSATLAVGAITDDKRRASFSNCGNKLDFVAPGVNVYSLYGNSSFERWSGTSIATPFVSGVAALYMSEYRERYGKWPTPDQVYQCLTNTAEDLGPPGKDDDYGFGLVRPDRVMTDTSSCFP